MAKKIKEVCNHIIRQTDRYFVGECNTGRIRIGELGVRCFTSPMQTFARFAENNAHLSDEMFDRVCEIRIRGAFGETEGASYMSSDDTIIHA